MIRKSGISAVLILFVLLSFRGFAEEEKKPVTKLNYKSAPGEETVFMRLRRSEISLDNASDKQRAKFGIAEYYFKHNAYLDAFRAFKDYSESFPPEASTLIAKAYLYKIANLKKDTGVAANIKKEIFENSFILLFSKYKTLLYASAFNNKYEIHYYVDKIQVFLNGGNFEEINP